MPRIDLHTHSTASDGILTPADLVSRAQAVGVEILALTDHDTLAGIEPAWAAACRLGVELIPAIEFSCQWRGLGLHIVGLQIDPAAAPLQDAVARQQWAREQRAGEIARRLAKRGVVDPLTGTQQLAGRARVARPDFAHYLVAQGHVDSIKAAFKQYLGAGKVGDVKQFWPTMEEVVEWIVSSGGMAVLAHPNRYKMTNSKRRRLLTEFKRAGGQAMEVICGQQNQQATDYLAALAVDFGLWASVGSDFHSPDYPWQSLGGFGTLPASCCPVPLACCGSQAATYL